MESLQELTADISDLGNGGGGVEAFDDFPHVLSEAVPFLKFAGVNVAWSAGDYVIHQAFPATKGAHSPSGYWTAKLLYGIPFLLIGRIAADLIGGNTFLRAFIIATIANSLMQIRYLFTASPEYNITVFLIHEGLLIPLCLLIAGKDGEELIPFMRRGPARAAR